MTWFTSKGKSPVIEGMRLGAFNLLYILISIAVVVVTGAAALMGALFIEKYFPNLFIIIAPTGLLVFLEIGLSAYFYFKFWGRFLSSYSEKILPNKAFMKTFLTAVIGVLPNLFIFAMIPYLPLANSDSCGAFVWFPIAYTIFLGSTIVMPCMSFFCLKRI